MAKNTSSMIRLGHMLGCCPAACAYAGEIKKSMEISSMTKTGREQNRGLAAKYATGIRERGARGTGPLPRLSRAFGALHNACPRALEYAARTRAKGS